MNLEDESYLSASFDQELDPSDQQHVEWAIKTDPELQERFQALSLTHELLSNLPRPGIPLDLAPEVLRRIGQQRDHLRARRLYRVGLWTATAASVLAAVLFAQNPQLLRTPPAKPTPTSPSVAQLQPSVPSTVASLPHSNAIIAPDSKATATEPVLVASADAGQPPVPTESDAAAPNTSDKFLALLDRPEVHRVVIPIDRLGDDAVGTVHQIVRDSSRKDPDYARFTLAPGLIIDPSHPQGAEVFVVIVDESERRHLLEALGTHFPSIGEETLGLSEIPALLAEVGKVSILPGKSAAGLIDPPPPFEPVATKFHPDPARQPERRLPTQLPVDDGPRHPAPPSGFRFDSLVKESNGMSGRGSSAEGRVTLIVWVPRPDETD